VYRPADEIEAMFERDPIRLLAEQLIAEGALTQAQYEQMQADITREVDAIYQEVERVPLPDPAHVLDHLYGEPPAHYQPLPLEVESEPTTMVAAFNRTFHAAMETFDTIVVFGEDIEDPKGGVFGFTKGLSSKYPERVRNSPLAEATIVGTAVGLAAMGYRPVFEIQFIDFITPGFHQLVSQIATLRWRSKGEWKCPLVIYSPYGAYLPAGGMWHSQSNDGWWAHTPGIRVAIPSTPEDIAGLFWAAIQDDDPTMFLIPEAHLPRAHACAGVPRHPVRQGSHPPRRDGCHRRRVGEHAGVGVPSRRAVRAAGRLTGDYRPAHAGAVRLGDR
jgi:2-oxoisovalerate dehydrogenase E1 component